MTFAKPARTESKTIERFEPSDHIGELLLFEPTAVEEGVKTRYGIKDTVTADIHVIDGQQAPNTYKNAYVYATVLIDQLRSLIGEQVLGRLALEETATGGSYYMLDDPTLQDQLTADRFVGTIAA